MRSESILVIGSRGYVGSALVAQLIAHRVIGLDCGNSVADAPRRFETLSADELAAHGAIILVAGHCRSPAACAASPAASFANNVDSFVDLVQAARPRAHLGLQSLPSMWTPNAKRRTRRTLCLNRSAPTICISNPSKATRLSRIRAATFAIQEARKGHPSRQF